MRPSRLVLTSCLLAGVTSYETADAQSSPMRELCVDRPGKDTPPCVVDEGSLLIEVGAIGFSRHKEEDSSQIDLGDLLLRYGLTQTIEAQLGFTPYSIVRFKDDVTGGHRSLKGSGDLTAALKVNFNKPDGGGTLVAAQGFVTAPVGKTDIGAAGWEAGIIVPVSFELTDRLSLTLNPEVDLLHDETGGGHHLAYVGVVSLSRQLGKGFEASAEIWSMVDRDPTGRRTMASFDLSMAWTPHHRPDLQVDAEVDFGLTRETPSVELKAGLAYRFR